MVFVTWREVNTFSFYSYHADIFQHYVIADANTEGPPEDGSLLQVFLHRGISLYYQESQFGPDFATLKWLHSNRSLFSGCSQKYKVDVYSQEDINSAELQRDLTELMTFETTEKTLNLSSIQFHEAAPNETNYFRVSSFQDNSTCEISPYFHQFVCTGLL